MAILLVLCCSLLLGCTVGEPGFSPVSGTEPEIIKWTPVGVTDPVGEDPDDPAIWIHPTSPELSLVVVTSKAAAPNGAIVVYDLEGKVVQRISGLDRPNNVDIRQSVLGG